MNFSELEDQTLYRVKKTKTDIFVMKVGDKVAAGRCVQTAEQVAIFADDMLDLEKWCAWVFYLYGPGLEDFYYHLQAPNHQEAVTKGLNLAKDANRELEERLFMHNANHTARYGAYTVKEFKTAVKEFRETPQLQFPFPNNETKND